MKVSPQSSVHIILTVGLLLVTLTGCYTSPPPGEPDETAQRLVLLLADPHPDIRRTAALSLGKIASTAATDGLIHALSDSDPHVREHAAWALGELPSGPPSSATVPLIHLLTDPVPLVGRSAAASLGKSTHTAGIREALSRLLRDGTPRARRAAVLAFVWLELPESFPTLVDALDDPDAAVRQGVLAALGELVDARAIPFMAMRLKRDDDAGVRSEAAYRLGKLGDQRVLSVLGEALVDTSPNVRRWATWAIGELTTPDELRSAT